MNGLSTDITVYRVGLVHGANQPAVWLPGFYDSLNRAKKAADSIIRDGGLRAWVEEFRCVYMAEAEEEGE